LVDTEPTLYKPGQAHTECTVCEEVLKTKTIPQLTPSAPKISSLVNEPGGIRVRWYGVPGADYFRIYRRGSGQKSWQYIDTTSETSYLDKTVTNNNYWRYTVRSCNEGGFGAYDTIGIYTKFLSAPKITSAVNTINGIKLQWTPIKGATRYYVYRNRVGLSNWTYIGSSTTTTFNDNKIKNANGVDYRYTVKAHCGNSNGYTSGYYSAGYIIRRLSAPIMKTAVSYPTGLYISWTPIPGTTGYYVYRKTSKSSWKMIGTAAGSTRAAYFDKTAVKGVKYTYTVKACYGKTLSDYYPKGITCVDKY
jgi:fibronectin type 3 domain-containing protein